jgi:hypothetical protein
MGYVGQPVLTPARQDLGAQQRPVAEIPVSPSAVTG